MISLTLIMKNPWTHNQLCRSIATYKYTCMHMYMSVTHGGRCALSVCKYLHTMHIYEPAKVKAGWLQVVVACQNILTSGI
jgi:hypothetical protein